MMARAAWILLAVLLAAASAGADGGSAYQQISGPCNLEFPRDHGPHPDFRTEWWYYTGNVQSPDGRPFGFQLTFFRSRVSPPGTEASWPVPTSAWRTPQIYLAHLAVSDIARQKFHHDERVTRGALGLGGAELSTDSVTVHLHDWRADIGEKGHRLRAASDHIAIDFDAVPLKPPVLHGERGYSRKGPRPEQASCYYSFTRLHIRGHIRVGAETFPVGGSAWMDHEHSSAPLDTEVVGWDWFSLQFDDNTELMVYLLRTCDGSYSGQSAGTYVKPSGESIHLAREELAAEILERWESPQSGARYPLRWRIRIPALEIDVLVTPKIRDQELHTPGSTRITYWEGSVFAEGRVRGHSTRGNGYMELTGYVQPLDDRL